MERLESNIIFEVRKFSRFYTNILGLLNQCILDSSYSLTEARVLIEIYKTSECTANMLIENLSIDRGYISRILKRFQADDLIIKEKSLEDGRVTFLNLTLKGKDVLRELEEKSNSQVENILSPLSLNEKKMLMKSMQCIENLLDKKENSIVIRNYDESDIDYIIKRHKELYKKEYGFFEEFANYVEKYLLEFNKNHDENKENIWIAEYNGKQVGVIAAVKTDNDYTAQLRWFLIEPEMRGKGLGRKLVQVVLNFCKERNYKHIFLWTANILKTARHIYASYGFKLTETVENTEWTNEKVLEEKWDLFL